MAKKNKKTAVELMNNAHKERLKEADKQAKQMADAQKKRLAEASKKAIIQAKEDKEQHKADLKTSEGYKNEILEYLESEQEFTEGFVLLSKYSKNRCLLAQIQRKGLHSKMIYELEKFSVKSIIKPSNYQKVMLVPQRKLEVVGGKTTDLRAAAPTLKTELTPEQRKEALDEFKGLTGSNVDPEQFPDELKETYEHACKYYHIFRHYHEVMKIAKTDEDRKAALLKLKPAEEYKAQCWAKIDKWVKTGELDEEKPLEPTNKDGQTEAANTADDISKAKSYVSKMLKTLEYKKAAKYETQKAELAKRVKVLQRNGKVPEKHKVMLVKHGLIT